MLKIGICKEYKTPVDYRVVLNPTQLSQIQHNDIKFVVQPSDIRCFSDREYKNAGIELQDDLSDCDMIIGVKEVPVDKLIPNKHYMFFSHVIKKQPHNKNLMRCVLSKNITLIDYEVLTDNNGKRIVAFGKEAGIVGTYNALRIYGLKSGEYKLPLAQDLFELNELYDRINNLPHLNIRLMITGKGGRVASGICSVIEKTKLQKISPEQYLQNTQTGVYCLLAPKDYIVRGNGEVIVEKEFYTNPTGDYKSNFLPFAKSSNMYIAGHFWDDKSPKFFTLNDIGDKSQFPIDIISDVSCDLDGAIPTTLKETTMDDIAYDVCRRTGTEQTVLSNYDNITVTAVDNLPSAIPRQASTNFGNAFIQNVLPYILNDDGRIKRATICQGGKLMPTYNYLEDYAK